ncbi:TPA: AraC family transcriptional regulator [Pseudomonas putida]|uniref:AraC family transcriptional regulator n=1 Tax=Pseudomonas putida TaxID=303 RepID=UPI00110CED3C|nr:AraC family transcriptional regulator [Pseudomonas putida]MDD1992680.1 AraC family transcriptional regulator [Pseudomonas putida]HDS0919659.1 AraC family transcriptional regulator [Pseudomonas putida]HDS0931759.1 AraC family transcriptional regulator [Pseudomonas putida]HDS1782387.1 AraC family transcriptional regulator [Pseudomonas putida]HDS3797036.1 AraC family transcriptional regulator [Pseudomonas putida]
MHDNQAKQDWVKLANPNARVERFEAFFGSHAFDPHRHDTYAIGRTVSGVHRFRYRGESKVCLAGETMIIHPDEQHDGCAGSDSGLRYRGIYIPPALAQEIMHGKPLPFFAASVTADSRIAKATDSLLSALDEPFDPLAEDDALQVFMTLMAELSGAPIDKAAAHFASAGLAREYMDDNLDQPITLDDLAACAGRDRWNLSQDFRTFFGTSPHRYLTLRRLDRVKQLALSGKALAEAAPEAGFFDQSHMSRHFKKAFGLSPSRWCNLRKA